MIDLIIYQNMDIFYHTFWHKANIIFALVIFEMGRAVESKQKNILGVLKWKIY